MNTKTISYIFFTVFVFTLLIPAHAQEKTESVYKKYEIGYVIKESGDSISGSIELVEGKEIGHIIRCTSENHEVKEFEFSEIKEYKGNEDLFIKKSFYTETGKSIKHAFFKLETKGAITLYSYTTRHNTGEGVRNLGRTTSRTIYYLEKNGYFDGVGKKKFNRNMIEYFSPDEEIVRKLESREFKYKDLKEMAELYNSKN